MQKFLLTIVSAFSFGDLFGRITGNAVALPENYQCTSISLIGDANGDGNIDNADSQIILNYFSGFYEKSDNYNLCCYDVDENGIVDNADSQLVLNYFSGVDVSSKAPNIGNKCGGDNALSISVYAVPLKSGDTSSCTNPILNVENPNGDVLGTFEFDLNEDTTQKVSKKIYVDSKQGNLTFSMANDCWKLNTYDVNLYVVKVNVNGQETEIKKSMNSMNDKYNFYVSYGSMYAGCVDDNGSSLCTLPLGESFNHFGHVFSINSISSDSVVLLVGGSYSPSLREGDSYSFSSGRNITILKINYLSQEGYTPSVVFKIDFSGYNSYCSKYGQCILYEGDSINYLDRVFSINYIGPSSVVLNLNGQLTNKLSVRDSQLIGGMEILISNINYGESTGGIGSVYFIASEGESNQSLEGLYKIRATNFDSENNYALNKTDFYSLDGIGGTYLGIARYSSSTWKDVINFRDFIFETREINDDEETVKIYSNVNIEYLVPKDNNQMLFNEEDHEYFVIGGTRFRFSEFYSENYGGTQYATLQYYDDYWRDIGRVSYSNSTLGDTIEFKDYIFTVVSIDSRGDSIIFKSSAKIEKIIPESLRSFTYDADEYDYFVVKEVKTTPLACSDFISKLKNPTDFVYEGYGFQADGTYIRQGSEYVLGKYEDYVEYGADWYGGIDGGRLYFDYRAKVFTNTGINLDGYLEENYLRDPSCNVRDVWVQGSENEKIIVCNYYFDIDNLGNGRKSRRVFWHNNNVLVGLRFYMNEELTEEEKQEIFNSNVEEFINSLKGRPTRIYNEYEIFDLFDPIYGLISKELGSCQSKIPEEICYPYWNCEIFPTVCPQHGTQTIACRETNCGFTRDYSGTNKCVPGICSGCAVPRWRGYKDSDSVCIPYGTRLKYEKEVDVDEAQEGYDYGGDTYLEIYNDYSAYFKFGEGTYDGSNWSMVAFEGVVYEGDSYKFTIPGIDKEYSFRVAEIMPSSGTEKGKIVIEFIFEIEGYCDVDGRLKEQRDKRYDGTWATCQNNYECRSNLCSNGECIPFVELVSEQATFWRKMGCRVSSIVTLGVVDYNECLAGALPEEDYTNSTSY